MTIKRETLSTSTGDVVAVIDDSGNQVFPGARSIRASINGEIRYMIHPLEDGSSTADHKIVLPDAVTLAVILDPEGYRSTYQEIKRIARDDVNLTVQTKSDTFLNMRIESYPAEEDPRMYDTIRMQIGLRSIETERPTSVLLAVSDVASPSDASTVQRGEQSPTEPEASVAARAADNMAEFLQ